MILKNLEQLNKFLPKKGRIMAIDVGSKRLGVALADDSRFIASPKLVINRKNNQKDFAKIDEFINQNQVSTIVIGLPIHMNGAEHEMTEFCRNFATNLDDFLQNKLPIFLFEERLTSFEARNMEIADLSRGKKNKFIDDIAASFILQHFLDEIAFLKSN